jgi:hypothetical protein
VRKPASTPAFDFEEVRFDHGDVVLAAIGWSEWQRLERWLTEVLSCEADARNRGEKIAAGELRAEVVAFRRSRGLLAGEDYLRWLAERSLSSEDVIAHLERKAFHERSGSRRRKPPACGPRSLERIEQTIDAEAVLSGRLRSWAERLARCAAAIGGLEARGENPSADSSPWNGRLVEAASSSRTSGLTAAEVAERAPRIAELLTAEGTFESLIATPGVIDQRLDLHRLDWQRLVWDEVIFDSEGAAREAAMMVREDGLELGEVVTLARVNSQPREAYWSEVPELASLLLGGDEEELLGPFPSEGSWRLVALRSRVPVSSEIPELRDRARSELVEDALGRYLAGRVFWHVGY